MPLVRAREAPKRGPEASTAAHKGKLSGQAAQWWPGLHQPVVPLHLHKGVGWPWEENPCISNHLMQPMTARATRPFLQPTHPGSQQE